jgi:hypothetical protein
MHLQHQYKKKEDLEIYEMDYISNANLQEVCDLKQPVFFASEHTEHLFSKLHPDLKEEVVVKDIGDYHRSSASSSDASTQITGITLSFSSAYGLMDSDPKHIFYSENNGSFLEEADFIPTFSKFSSKIGSPWSVKTSYDLLFASPKVETPWKFHTASQRFLVTSPGEGIRVKMTPWKSRKYMDLVYDYETLEFWCRSVQDSNIKCLDFDVKQGYVLYIPPYWFYSIEFLDKAGSTDSKISFVASFTYTTPMNILANAQHYGQHLWLKFNSTPMAQVIVRKTKEEARPSAPIDVAAESKETTTPEEKNASVAEIQEMLSVIEKPKVPTENQE